MSKIPLSQNVLDAAIERTKWTFDNFERVYLSFSGGKDSTVMLHIAVDEARERGVKFGVLFVDLEGQYKLTIEHIEKCYAEYADVIEPFWCCLPLHLRNAVSVYEPFWMCWDKDQKENWIREMPEHAINEENNNFDFFHAGMEFEEFVPLFGEWYSEGKSCACLVGIRADESLNRYRTLANRNKTTKDGKQWTTKVTENVFNVYPVYDWASADLWLYHYKTNKPYNELYDLMHKSGVPIGHMRICQPYGDDQRRGLWLFHLIEPYTWSKVVARVNGANSGALYVQETGNINGYHKITKPEGHTWKSFAEMFLDSLPPKTKEHYENKILIFCKWWEERAYPDGIPDEVDYRLEAERKVPSWRRICKSLLRNDFWMKGLGFSQHKSAAYEKYLDLMKRRKEQEEWKTQSFNF